jgi:hypothetical protein
MSDHRLLLDLAKVRQVELLYEARKTRIGREFNARPKVNPVLKRLKIFLSSLG